MRPGRAILPRLRANQNLGAAVRNSGIPYGPLARACGCGEAHFSFLINAVGVPSTPKNIDVLLRAADAVKFPRDQVFIDEPTGVEAQSTNGASR